MIQIFSVEKIYVSKELIFLGKQDTLISLQHMKLSTQSQATRTWEFWKRITKLIPWADTIL